MPRRREDFSEHKRRLLREQPISRLFPNVVTLAGLCCGLTSIRFAMLGRFEVAVAFILAAALIDGMDGRIARLLGATSMFGAQLDSLSDFFCFGVAPVLVLYIWQLNSLHGIGWAVVLFFAICCALRLARFNTALVAEQPKPWQKQFFTGVPSPAGGVIALLPLMLFFQTNEEFVVPPIFIAAHVVLMGGLMASRVPTFAAKNVRVAHDKILPLMVVAALLLALLIIEPWLTLSALSVIYLLAIPFSVVRWRHLTRKDARGAL